MKIGKINLIKFILITIVVILQIMPLGIATYTLVSASSLKYEIKYFSYFSFYSFLHCNYIPMISAVAVVVACLFNLITKNKQKKRLISELICILIALICGVIIVVINPTLVAGIVAGLLFIIFMLLMTQINVWN